jgi:hypothetical protein
MEKQQVNIILQSLLADLFCKNYSELSEKELRHINKYVDYDFLPDRILSDNDELYEYIDWNRISKMKAIRLVSKNFDLTKYINLKKYDYKVREIFWFIKSDYMRLFDFFSFDLTKCSHEDVYLLLCLGEEYFEKAFDLERYKFSFIETMDIIRAYKYRRDIILKLDYEKLKNYQYTEIISNMGEEVVDLFDIDELSTLNWLELLNYQPDLIEICDTEKFKKGDLFNLIQLVILFETPDLSYLIEEIDKKEISAFGWEKLLICNPNKFTDMCDFGKLNEDNWSRISRYRPELIPYKL